jgi:hypothetical protein
MSPSQSVLQTVGPHPFQCHNGTTLWRRSAISLPWPRSRCRDITGRPLSSPVRPPTDRPPTPTSDGSGWLLQPRWGLKGKPSRGVAITKSRLISSSTSPFLFDLPPASFGQPATSPSLSSAPLLAEQVVPLSSSTTSRRSSEEDREKNPSPHRQPWLSSWKCSSPFDGRL